MMRPRLVIAVKFIGAWIGLETKERKINAQ